MGGVLLHPYRLADGTQVVLRPVRAADKRLLREAFARLSPESARMRFLGPKARLTTSELRYLTEVDGLDHVAVVAVLAHAPTHVVAVGRFVRLPEDPQTAEVAIVVGDPWQRQGVGRHLGLALADLARERGVRRFVATMLSDNVASHRLFGAISDRLSTRHDGAIDELCAELAA
jgi:RimJ/RimL family protein N-acetyltransferase